MEVAGGSVTWSQFLGSLGALALILGAIEKARKAFGAKEKREVSFAQEFATKEEFEKEKAYAQERRKAIYEKFDTMSKETQTQFMILRKDIKEDFDGVHGRVTEMVECLGELRGEVKQALKQ